MRMDMLLGWGIVIYAVMFLLWSGFVTYGFVEGFAPRAVGLSVLIGTALLAGSSLRLHAWQDILPYSIVWTVMMGTLDAVFSVPYSGWQLYFDWNIWFGYAMVAIVPLFSPYVRLERFSSRPPRGS